MPKVHNTRKDKARKLVAQIKRGPGFSDTMPFFDPRHEPNKNGAYCADAAAVQFKRWAEYVLLPELWALFPEIAQALKEVTE